MSSFSLLLSVCVAVFSPLQSADVDSLIKSLKANDKDRRIQATKALERLGAKAEPAIPALIECLSDDRPETYDVRVGTLAARALVAIGKPAEQPILKALESTDVKVFTGACEALRLMKTPPDAALETLFTALADRSETGNKATKPKQRAWVAARVLVKYGVKARPATGDLIDMLHSKNFHEQVAACTALAGIGKDAHRAVPKLVELVSDGVTSTRGHAAMTLAKIGPIEKTDIVAPIEKAIDDFSAIVRGRALLSLAELGPKAKSALPAVQKKLRSQNYSNRCEAAVAAWRISGDAKEPVDVLTKLAGNIDFELDALQMLGRMGTVAKQAAPTLIEMLDSKDPDKRFELVQTLRLIDGGSEDVRELLKKLAKSDPDADVRRIAGSKKKTTDDHNHETDNDER